MQCRVVTVCQIVIDLLLSIDESMMCIMHLQITRLQSKLMPYISADAKVVAGTAYYSTGFLLIRITW